MGNCCKKKIYEKKQNESDIIENEKNKSNNYNLTIKNEKNIQNNGDEKEKNINIIFYNNEPNTNTDSKTRIYKKDENVEYNSVEKEYHKKIDEKKKKKYIKILLNYIKLNEKIKNENNLTLYIINKIENEDIINLYNKVIKNEEYKLLNDEEDSEKVKIIEKVINSFLLEGKDINEKITVYNYDQCMKLKNKIIDIVDNNFIKDMKLSKKNNETICIKHYQENGSAFMILQFKENKKNVKIEKRDKYYIRELDDENNKNNKKNLDIDYKIIKQNFSEIDDINKNSFNFMSEHIIEINNNKNDLIEDGNLNSSFKENILIIERNKKIPLNSDKIDDKNKNIEDDIFISFKILLLFNAQNYNILLKERENDFLCENECYYLLNKNSIINLKKEINNKNKNINDISIIINDYIRKNKYKKFEEFFKNIDIIIQDFEKENKNFFNNEYDFKIIKNKEFLPNNKEIINSINNSKIIYPSNFILIKPEIYNCFIKSQLFEDESNNNIIETINKVSLIISGNQIYLKNIKKEENIIYVCNSVKNDNGKDSKIEDINISYILIYNLKNTFMTEYNLFIKDNDINNYISKRKLKANINETKKIINEENEEIGFFVNLKENNDLIIDLNDNHSEKFNNIENNNKNKDKDNNKLEEKENYNKNNYCKSSNYNSRFIENNNMNNNSEIFLDIDSPNESENNIDNNIDNDSIIKSNNNKDINNIKNYNNFINSANNDKDLIQENNYNKDLIQENNYNKDLIQENNYNKDLIQENNYNKDLIQQNDIIENNKDISNNLIENNEIKKEIIKRDEDRKQRLIGLVNIKNDSYVTSLLQCLYNCPQLTNYFISNNKFKIGADNDNIDYKELIEKENNNNENEISKNTLSYKYYEVIYHLYYKNQNSKIINSYAPINFIEYIENAEPTFKKIIYKSPKRLFFYMINNIQKELNKKENIKNMEVLENLSNIAISIQPNVDNSDNLFKTYLNDFIYKNNSIIDKCFSGIKSIIMTCLKCNNIDYSFKPFYFLNVSISQIENEKDENGKITLNKFFEKNFSKDKSILNNIIKLCKNCNILTDFSFSNQMFLSPKLLVVILDDAKEKSDLFKLIFNLDINEYLIQKNNGYELIGIVTYFKEKGMNVNYIAYCKVNVNENEKWYCFCDDFIYEVNKNRPEIDIEDKNRIPYILFYNEIKKI